MRRSSHQQRHVVVSSLEDPSSQWIDYFGSPKQLVRRNVDLAFEIEAHPTRWSFGKDEAACPFRLPQTGYEAGVHRMMLSSERAFLEDFQIHLEMSRQEDYPAPIPWI